MQTCVDCGAVSEFERCYSCYKKANGIRVTERTPCVVCGKPSQGFRCKDCRSTGAKKYKKDYCIDCGKELGLSYVKNPRRCVSCAGKHYGALRKSENNKNDPETLTCPVCGKVFPFKRVQSTNKPAKVCSYSCGSKLRHLTAGHTADNMIAKIREYIESVTHYVSESEIKAKLSITRQQLRRYNINTAKINVDLGRTEMVGGSMRAKRKDATRGTWHIPNIQVERDSPEAKAMHDRIVSWIADRKTKTTVNEILKHFHVDYYSTWRRFGFDIAELHNEAGVPYSRNVSWYERKVAEAAIDMFGRDDVITQKRFAGLKSSKGWSLRFDIYIESKNCLIEVDGEQHYTDDHIYCKQLDTDRIKAEYAASNGITLERLRIAPTATFENRTNDLLVKIKNMDVVKESELREPVQPELF